MSLVIIINRKWVGSLPFTPLLNPEVLSPYFLCSSCTLPPCPSVLINIFWFSDTVFGNTPMVFSTSITTVGSIDIFCVHKLFVVWLIRYFLVLFFWKTFLFNFHCINFSRSPSSNSFKWLVGLYMQLIWNKENKMDNLFIINF